MRYLIVRIAAYGDCLTVTPLIRYLKESGNEVYVLTSETGEEIFRHNIHIDKLIVQKKDSVPTALLEKKFEEVSKENNCDKIINLCGSIESKLVLHPIQPEYNWSKQERFELCNRNYYEYTLERGLGATLNYDSSICNPEVFFTEKEKEEVASFKSNYLGKKLILVGLSGSSAARAYPYLQYVISTILEVNKDVIFITTGDHACTVLEVGLEHERVIHRSNVWSFRQAMLACSIVDLVIAPDTGLIHASGAYDVPKICLLGSTTKENITKHFKNDYSLESTTSCSPCFRILYNATHQCPTDTETKGAFCMSVGLDPNLIIENIVKVVGVNNDKLSSM